MQLRNVVVMVENTDSQSDDADNRLHESAASVTKNSAFCQKFRNLTQGKLARPGVAQQSDMAFPSSPPSPVRVFPTKSVVPETVASEKEVQMAPGKSAGNDTGKGNRETKRIWSSLSTTATDAVGGTARRDKTTTANSTEEKCGAIPLPVTVARGRVNSS